MSDGQVVKWRHHEETVSVHEIMITRFRNRYAHQVLVAKEHRFWGPCCAGGEIEKKRIAGARRTVRREFGGRVVGVAGSGRTILDSIGAEHLLGKGDMLFLPPGSSRLVRVHGAFVTETEINRVVDFWKAQAEPEYDQTYLTAPPSDDDEMNAEEFDGEQDPMYEDAVRVVLEMGKASTSTLQRRLRLGYGRAARILDMMQREGIIGPPDGSKPREVLKRPDWLREVEDQLR